MPLVAEPDCDHALMNESGSGFFRLPCSAATTLLRSVSRDMRVSPKCYPLAAGEKSTDFLPARSMDCTENGRHGINLAVSAVDLFQLRGGFHLHHIGRFPNRHKRWGFRGFLERFNLLVALGESRVALGDDLLQVREFTLHLGEGALRFLRGTQSLLQVLVF